MKQKTRSIIMITASNYIHDLPSVEDALGRMHFADALSKSLVLPKGSPGLVVGLEGGWGSGKSTLVGFVTKSLSESDEEHEPILVEFNPWIVSNTGALVEALIGQIAASIGKNFAGGKQGIEASKKLLNYVGLLKNLKYVPGLSWAGNVIEDLPDLMQTIASAAEHATDVGQKAICDFEKLLPSLDISQKRDEVIKAISELDRPIVVVIDDLDRLPVEEIRAMIQTIKAVADFPRVTYLLAYDRQIIARALASDEKSGLQYLEKIVQVAYPIPPLSQRQLKKFANNKVHDLLKTLDITLRPYEEDRFERGLNLLTKLARHPRDIVRVVNRLTLSLPMTNGGVNAVDVIVFEALSQRFPELREAIREHSTDFINNFFREDQIENRDEIDWSEFFTNDGEEKAQYPWQKHLPKDTYDQSVTNKACLFLFTPQEKEGIAILAEDYLGIADPDRLARLFSLTSIEEVPEAKEIHELLQNPEKLQNILQLDECEQMNFWLEWLNNYTPSCPAPDINGCVEKLSEVSKDLTNQHRLTSKEADKFSGLMEKLLRLRCDGYEGIFLSIAQNAPLSISETVLLTAASEIGKWGNAKEYRVAHDKQLITDDDVVDNAIQIWLNRVRDSISQDELYKEANLTRVLYRYAQFNNDAYRDTYNAIYKVIKTDKGLAAFLRYFVEGSHVLRDRLMLVEDAKKFMRRIAKSEMKEEYSWLVKLLGEENTIQFVREQAAKHKKLKVPASQ
ncbi:MAG: P-loop NTPase fold protein [Gallionella sp.]